MRSGLNRKILFPALITIALGVVAVLLVSHLQARAVVQQELTKRLQREVQLTSRLLDNWVQARMTDLVNWSGQEVLAESLTEKGYYGRSALQGAQAFLDNLQKGYPYYEGIILANGRGDVLASSSRENQSFKGINLSDRSYFKETMHGKATVSEVLVSRLSANRIFTITVPIAVDGAIVGVIGGVVNFAHFKSLFLDDFKLKQHGYAFLTDRQQQVLASSRNNEDDLSGEQHRVFLGRIAAGDRGSFIHLLDGEETLTVFQHLHWINWSFGINQSLDDTLRPLRRTGQVGAAGALIVLCLIVLVIGTLFRRLIIERLRAMLQVIGQVKTGDFSRRIPDTPGRADEISELIEAFNGMITRLDQTVFDMNEEIRIRKDTESALARHQEDLEQLIEQRSLDLQKEIQERRRAEERLVRAEKLEMIGTLAGGVAHDLNNILSGIVTYPDLLLMKVAADSPLAKPLQTIKESGERASAIVQDLLTLARRGVTVKEPVNLNRLVAKYLHSPEFLQLRTHHGGIAVVTDCAADLLNILGSPVHLAKTIMNLVTNAAESMEDGGEIRIRTENRYIDSSLKLYEHISQGEYVVLEVEDQGSGIRPEDLDKIFEPFYTSKKMGKSGTGLGMAVVWGTVKDHQGYINCESRLALGTRFTLFFPVTAQEHRQQLQTVSLGEYQGNGEKILVIDDIEEQREIAATILTELGYRVSTAASGEEALELARLERFDLLLLDMILGSGIDGLDTYRRFLALAPRQKAIITSGFSETERITEALRLGVGQYVKKPYMIVKLGIAIRDALKTGTTG
jgi:C4-dicarboxylate-specific signal transduction histidine kinase/CheY-like chemotaxis protein